MHAFTESCADPPASGSRSRLSTPSLAAQVSGSTRPRLPLLLGATNPRMVALAGEVSDGLMVHLLTPRSAIAARVDAARSSAGRELSSAAGVLVSVDADEAAALARARAELAAALIVPMFRGAGERGGRR